MIKKVIDIEVKSDNEKVDKLNKSLKDNSKLTSETTQSTDNLNTSFDDLGGTIDGVTGGALSSFRSGLKTIGNTYKALHTRVLSFSKTVVTTFTSWIAGMTGASTSTGLFAGALKVATVAGWGLSLSLSALGIPLIVAGVSALVAWFTKFDAGMKVASQTMAGLSGVVTGIVNNFKALMSGDIIGFFRGIKEEVESNVEAAGDLADAEIRLKETQTSLKESNAELNATLQENQQIIRDATSSYEERLEAQQKVNEASEELLKNAEKEAEAELEVAQANLRGASTETELRDAKEQVAEANAKLIKAESDLTRERFRGERQARKIEEEEQRRLDKIEAERLKKIEKANKSERDRLKELTDLNNKYREGIRDLEAETQEESIELARQRGLEEINALEATEEEKNLIRKALNEKFDLEAKQLAESKEAEEEREALEREENRLSRLNDFRKNFRQKLEDEEAQDEYEKEQLRLERELEEKLLELEELEATEREKAEIREYYANKVKESQIDAEKEANRQKDILRKQDISLSIGAANAIMKTIGEHSVVAKGVAVAQALWNTYQGITESLKAPTIAQRVAEITFASTTGFGAVKDIISTDAPGTSGGGSARGGGGSTNSPTFNVVGDNTESVRDELAGERGERPIQTYVTTSDVSNAAEYERKRLTNTTFM